MAPTITLSMILELLSMISWCPRVTGSKLPGYTATAILSSYSIQHITSGGTYVEKTMYCTQISDLISAFIIYLCGFVLFFKVWLNRLLDKREEKNK